MTNNIRHWKTLAGKERWKRRVKMLTSHITPEMKVLEVGCGTGNLTIELQKTGAEVVAIDISPNLINIARKNIKGDYIMFLMQNAHDLKFESNRFDTIIGSSILHHLNVDIALKEFYRVLKPNGSIYFTEPNMMNPQIAIQKNIPFIKKLAGDSPNETAFFRWQLKKKLMKYGFKDIELKNFDFLHPSIPRILIPLVKYIGNIAESIPLIKEISGSIYIKAKK